MRTVYIVVKDGVIQEAYADHLTDLVVLDLDTQDEQMLKEVNGEIEKLKKAVDDPEQEMDIIEIY